MNHTFRSRFSLLLLCLLLRPGLALAAPSLVLSPTPGWNGWTVETKVKAGFREHGGAGEDAITDTQTMSIVPGSLAAGASATARTVSATRTPLTGAAKDKATGTLAFSYTAGSATAEDAFTFAIASTTSAVSAKQNFGSGLVPADAFFECEITLRTFAPLTGGASIRLPAMPTLVSPATESLVATATGPISGFLLPGDPGFSMPLELTASQMFEYKLNYTIVTPYGTDPTISYTFSGGAAGQAAVNVVPNGGFEIVGPSGSGPVSSSAGVVRVSAAESWTQSVGGLSSTLTTSLLPSTDNLAGNCGTMLSTTVVAGPDAAFGQLMVKLGSELPVNSRGSLDLRVTGGQAQIHFAAIDPRRQELDVAVVRDAASGWQHVTFRNPTLPCNAIYVFLIVEAGGTGVLEIDNVTAAPPFAPRKPRYDYTGGFGSAQRWISGFCYPNQIPVVGDFDGDGLDDLATFLRSAYPAQIGDVYVARNTGAGAFAFAGLWHPFFCIGDEIPAAGDFDGDGRDDIVTFVPTTGQVWVALSSGTAFCNGVEWYDVAANGKFFFAGEVPLVGDFNGDGLADIASCARGSGGGVVVALSTGRSFAKSTVWSGNFCPGTAIPKAGDVNGDGRADIVCFRRDSVVGAAAAKVEVAFSTGTSVAWGSPFWSRERFAPTSAHEPLLADLNGDGADDILAVLPDGQVLAAVHTPDDNFGSGPGGVDGTSDWQWHADVRNPGEIPLVGHFNRDMNDDLCVCVRDLRSGDDFAASFVYLNGSPAQPFIASASTARAARAGDRISFSGSLGLTWQDRVKLVGPGTTILTPVVNSFSSTLGTITVPGGCYPTGLYRLMIFADAAQEQSSNSWPVWIVNPLDAWFSDNFSAWERIHADVGGDAADPDGDGVPNLAEYVMGRDPHVFDANAYSWSFVGGVFQMSFVMRHDRGCVTVGFDLTDDLRTWHEVGSSAWPGTGPVGTFFTFNATATLPAGQRAKFGRFSFRRTAALE